MPECWYEAQLGSERRAVQHQVSSVPPRPEIPLASLHQVQAPAAAAGGSSGEAGGGGGQQPGQQPRQHHGHRQAGAAVLARGHQ